MSKISFISIFCILAMFLFVHCKSDNNGIGKANIKKLENKYSARAINYFSETVFSQDYVGAVDALSKWNKDIFIYLDGKLWPEDSLFVKNALVQINDLKLPIKLNLTNDTSIANVFMYFGDYDYLEQKLGIKNYTKFLGIGVIPKANAFIGSARIGIANNATSYSNIDKDDCKRMRQSIILEEITQVLGISGDSWMEYNSIFFEGKESSMFLSNLDKEVIKLLYEPCIPTKYGRTQFENEFKEVLYQKDASKKISNYLRQNNIPLRNLEYLRKCNAQFGSIYKYPNQVFIKLEGDYQKQDLEFCKRAIDLFNNVSDQLSLSLAPNDIWHEVPCIKLQYNDTIQQKKVTAERAIEIGGMRYNRRIRGSIKINYMNSGHLKDQEMKNIFVLRAMYKILGIDSNNDDITSIDSKGNITIKPFYKDVLSLLYNPVIPDGFSLVELENIIKTFKNEL